MIRMTAMTLLSVVLTGSAILSVQAAATTDPEQLVDAFVEDVITFQGRFEQALIDAAGKELERSSGTLEIERPGRFRWSYTDPYEQWLIADGLNMWSYDVDLEQVTVKPQAEALANTPALLLGGAEDALQQFESSGSYVDGDMNWVSLRPRNTDSGFERVDLGFSDGALNKMVFLDNLEQKTIVQLYDVVVNEPIDSARFEFSVPEGVDLVGAPAERKPDADVTPAL